MRRNALQPEDDLQASQTGCGKIMVVHFTKNKLFIKNYICNMQKKGKCSEKFHKSLDFLEKIVYFRESRQINYIIVCQKKFNSKLYIQDIVNEGVPKKNNIFFLELFFFINLNSMTHKICTIGYIVKLKLMVIKLK